MSTPARQNGQEVAERRRSQAVEPRRGELLPAAAPYVNIPSTAEETAGFGQIRRTITVGVLSSILMFGGIGTLAATTVLSGAVHGGGFVVIDSSVKRVQHLTGGIVAEIHVRDGDVVKAGQLLVKLDETSVRAELDIARKNYLQAMAQIARLTAERDDQEEISFPDEVLSEQADPFVVEVMNAEKRLLDARRSTRDGQILQIRERITQLDNQILGLDDQIKSVGDQIRLTEQELEGLRALYAKKIVSVGRLNDLERDNSELIGLRGKLTAEIASSKARIAESQIQITTLMQAFRTRASEELQVSRKEASQEIERIIQGRDVLKRVDVVSPVDGVVHASTVHTIGGIVSPNVDLMQIVPTNDKLVVETRISPADIDQIYPGQPARVRFSAFDRNTTPELNGYVDVVSADLVRNQQTEQVYYNVRLQVPPEEVARMGDVKLVPGMPAETLIRTSDRTILSFLVKPIMDQVERAFRES